MRTHFPWKELGYAAGFLCLPLALYVGTYFSTVTRSNPLEQVSETFLHPRFNVPVTVTKCVRRATVVASYPFADSLDPGTLRSFFSPIHQIDRRLRIDFWKDQILPESPPPSP